MSELANWVLQSVLDYAQDIPVSLACELKDSSAVTEVSDLWERRVKSNDFSREYAEAQFMAAWNKAGNDETRLLLLAILGKRGCTTPLNIFLSDQRKIKGAVSNKVAEAIIQYFMDPDVAEQWRPEAEKMYKQMIKDLDEGRLKIILPGDKEA